MTQHKHLKQLVRARMQKTGERYASARRQILASAEAAPLRERALSGGAAFHLPGNVPTTTALRVVLSAAGVQNPATRTPFSEALLFTVAGGVGIGVFSFLYEKEGFASFFLGGRHLWHDFEAYFEKAGGRLGLEFDTFESSGATAAAKALRVMLAKGQPCIAWLEMGLLPHRAAPASMLGGGYHVVTVYSIDDAAGTALIGDLADDPIAVPLEALAAARARIKQHKHRLMSVKSAAATPPLPELVHGGLVACHAGLLGEGAVKGAKGNFTLGALATWADRLEADDGEDSWARVFAPGPRLWNGLTMMHDFIEHYGTGGGLCRPLMAEGLREASGQLKDMSLGDLAARYERLGVLWSELAAAAFPPDVPTLRRAGELVVQRAEWRASGGAAAVTGLDAVRREMEALRAEFARDPIAAPAYRELRLALAARVRAIHEAEVDAHAAMKRCIDA